MKQMSHGVHPQEVVRSVDAHSLLAHSRLIRVTRRLVVVRVRDDRCTNSKNHGRVNFAVSVLIVLVFGQITNLHGNHGCLFFVNVEKLDQALLQSVCEVHAVSLR